MKTNYSAKIKKITNKNKQGFTLVELIAVITILGIGVASLLMVLSEVSQRAWYSDDLTNVAFCAKGAMEQSIVKNFSTIANASGNCSGGITWNRTVNNCNLAGTTWAVTDQPTDPYKLINVTASKSSSDVLVELFTIFSNNGM